MSVVKHTDKCDLEKPEDSSFNLILVSQDNFYFRQFKASYDNIFVSLLC